MILSREERISDKRLFVFDEVTSDIEHAMAHNMLKNSSFSRTESDKPELPDKFKQICWAKHLDPHEFITGDAQKWQTLELILAHYFGKENYYPWRVYINAGVYGDHSFWHTDVEKEEDPDVTALFYLCDPEWSIDDGGETLFYTDEHDAAVAVAPKLGRLVIFDGGIVHRATSPSRICTKTRYTLAVKLMEKEHIEKVGTLLGT